MGPGAPLQARPIDMGLPSGLLWASCNVGAEKPSDFGLYFSWGNVEGHRIDEGYSFTGATYNSTPAAAIESDLSLDQDAARVNLGSTWRMPTVQEFQELIDNCTYRWATTHGVDGALFISNVNGNTLFFPAAGYFSGTSLNNRGVGGNYWSSTFVSSANAGRFGVDESSVGAQESRPRSFGFSVRAVMPSP